MLLFQELLAQAGKALEADFSRMGGARVAGVRPTPGVAWRGVAGRTLPRRPRARAMLHFQERRPQDR